jgi:hypothetical protein
MKSSHSFSPADSPIDSPSHASESHGDLPFRFMTASFLPGAAGGATPQQIKIRVESKVQNRKKSKKGWGMNHDKSSRKEKK